MTYSTEAITSYNTPTQMRCAGNKQYAYGYKEYTLQLRFRLFRTLHLLPHLQPLLAQFI